CEGNSLAPLLNDQVPGPHLTMNSEKSSARPPRRLPHPPAPAHHGPLCCPGRGPCRSPGPPPTCLSSPAAFVDAGAVVLDQSRFAVAAKEGAAARQDRHVDTVTDRASVSGAPDRARGRARRITSAITRPEAAGRS